MSAGRRENQVKPCLGTLTGSNGMGGDVSGVRSRNSTGDDRGCPCQHTPSYPKREDMQRWCIDGMQPVVGTLHASEPPVVNLSPMQPRAWGSNDGLGGVEGHDGILDRKRVPASQTAESELMNARHARTVSLCRLSSNGSFWIYTLPVSAEPSQCCMNTSSPPQAKLQFQSGQQEAVRGRAVSCLVSFWIIRN